MYGITTYRTTALALCLFLGVTAVRAEPGDAEAVARARKDYDEAMKTNDAGLRNAMKIELAVQLAKARARKDKQMAEASARP